MKDKIRYIAGTLFCIGGLSSLTNSGSNYIIVSILFILFGLSLMPFIYEKYLYKVNINKFHILLPILLFVGMCITIPKEEIDSEYNKNTSNSNSKSNQSNNNSSNSVQANDNKNDNKTNYKNLTNITNQKLKENFISACKEINLNTSDIKELKKVEDWNSGPRYTFSYFGHKFILYAYDSGEISSITIANNNLDKIYLEGFEPYDVNNYIIRSDQISKLQVSAEASIKSALNHPDTAKFKWATTGSYSKNNGIYIVTGKVEAKNSLGVNLESNFYIEEEITNGNYNVVYMKLDDKVYVGTNSKIEKKERKELESNNNTIDKNESEIILKDGQKGSYGKEDLYDGEKYIRYYIPAGTYEAEALTKNAQFFIEEISIHKENGYDTSTSIRKVTLSKVGDKDTINISSDQCISLVVHTQIKLIKK